MKSADDKHGSRSWHCDGCGTSSPTTYDHHPPRDWETVDERHYCPEFACQQTAVMAEIEDRAVMLCTHARALAKAVTTEERAEAARQVEWHVRAIMALREKRLKAATEDDEPAAGEGAA
jgi:hypothetical protein